MGTRRWSFVEEPRPLETPQWRFTLGLMGGLAVIGWLVVTYLPG